MPHPRTKKESYALDAQLHSHRGHSFSSKEVLFKALYYCVSWFWLQFENMESFTIDFYKAYTTMEMLAGLAQLSFPGSSASQWGSLMVRMLSHVQYTSAGIWLDSI